MPDHDMPMDEYVAALLADEAAYSTMVPEPPKKPAHLPKPNTRFLQKIIKGTDSHNKALLAKETAESQARLKDLEKAGELRRLKTNPSAHDIRKRQLGDIHAILGGKKQAVERSDAGASHSRNSEDNQDRDRKRALGDRGSRGSRDDKHRRGRTSQRDSKRDSSSDGHHGRRSRRARHDETFSRDDEPRRGRPRRGGSKSPRRHRRSRSPEGERQYRRRSRRRSPSEAAPDPRGQVADVEDGDGDSDALSDLIGPQPAPRHRGRGAVRGAENLDRRFSESYDPRTDTQDDDDDWDDAVEAFRDLQKLRLNQPQRLRAAGFSERLIRNVEDGDTKTDKDVVWSKAGEKRAWDQGKVLNDDEVVHPPTLFSGDT